MSFFMSEFYDFKTATHKTKCVCFRATRRGGSRESLIDERLYNLILEYQSNRIEDQRSTLGGGTPESNTAAGKPTMPVDDITEIVNRQQIGRIDSQRANPPTPTKRVETPDSSANIKS